MSGQFAVPAGEQCISLNRAIDRHSEGLPTSLVRWPRTV
ncbi:hypothetical protein KPATCC21470_8624 [Kitasatospora purpeofusca]